MLKPEQKLDLVNNKVYKIEPICNSKVYTKEAAIQLLGLYYLVSWKSYTKLKKYLSIRFSNYVFLKDN